MSKLDVSREAGTLFYLLEKENDLSLNNIGEKISMQSQCVFLALGWLLRDNRIVCYQHNGELFVRLNKPPMTEIHY